jgi:lysozyme
MTKDMIKRHEGLRLRLYQCTRGKWTIGFGHNLSAKGISRSIAELIFEEDYAEAESGAKTLVKNWDDLSPARQDVLIDMTFQMGLDGMRKWENTLAAIERGDWKMAAYNMRLSLWAKQTPERARELIRMMEEG